MRVLVIHPWFTSIAGAELVALHTVRHLIGRGADVRLVTLSAPDFEAASRTSGVDLRAAVARGQLAVDLRCPPALHRRFPLAAIAWLHRDVRELASHVDLWVSTYNEANLGRPGLQYVHHPLFARRDLLRAYEIDDAAPGAVRSVYDRWVRTTARASPRAFRENETLVNSAFMAGVVREAYGIESTVLYPAFLDGIAAVPPDAGRADRLVSVGRISPDKHTLRLIDLMAAIHEQVPSLSFVVAGFASDPAYYDTVRRRADVLRLPVRFETRLGRAGVTALLRTSRYFLSAKRYEHFGITTLEALSAGALPFVHATGGSTEIVEDARLWYRSPSDLTSAVARFVASPALREEVRAALTGGLGRFHVSRFNEGLDASVERALARPRSGG